MIVKDEEDVIQRCLDSIIDHVDEVVVVDTGSTDKTVDIIRGYQGFHVGFKTKLETIPWNGSFADMRNKSMDLATGDVLFIIDADEYVEGQDWSQIRQAINMPNFIVGMVQVLNVTSQGAVRGERVMQPRLFLNHPDIRYKYAVHNQIDDAYMAYAKKMHKEKGADALVVGMGFEITHTGYELKPDEFEAKYATRAKVCREEIERAIHSGSSRDEAYYRYQEALFLAVIKGDAESALLWDEIEYDDLNVFNRWYARYIASRAILKVAQVDDDIEMMYKALGHATGMFDAMHSDQTGYLVVPEEPASWMITGAIMMEIARVLQDDHMRGEALIMMMEAFIRSLIPPQGMRCVINANHLYNDIKAQFDQESLGYKILDTTNLKKGVEAIRQIQRSLIDFDESLLELEDRKYL